MINVRGTLRGGSDQVDVNMSPLIDMVFLLLIFFVVTTSFVKETGVEVNRPTAATAVSQPKATILIGIDPADRIFFDNREVDVRAVRANVERALAENPEGAVVVVADRASTTGTTIEVMDGARLAGAANVSLAARLPEGAAP